METYYDVKYFNFQKDAGAFGRLINKLKPNHYINAKDKVIDFGCGGVLLAIIHYKKNLSYWAYFERTCFQVRDIAIKD